MTLADAGSSGSGSTSASTPAAALVGSGGIVGANGRAPSPAALPAAVAAPAAPQASPTPDLPVTATAASTTIPVPITVVHDGKTVTFTSTSPTVAVLLKRMGLHVNKLDLLTPTTTATIRAGLEVRLIRVTQKDVNVDAPIPFAQVAKNSTKVEMGLTTLSQTGANGISRATTRSTFQDGVLVSAGVLATKVLRKPVDEVTLVGIGQPTFVSHGGAQAGAATWYGTPGLSAASPTLPFGTVVRVTNVSSGKTINVVIRDRGPYSSPDRIIDLSPVAFAQIANLGAGVVSVDLAW